MSSKDHYLAVFMSNKASAKWKVWRDMSKEEYDANGARGVAAVKAWEEAHKDVIVYQGGPLGPTKRVWETRVEDVVNELTVFMVVRASSHEAAAKLFQDHPHITFFPCDRVDVMPLLGD